MRGLMIDQPRCALWEVDLTPDIRSVVKQYPPDALLVRKVLYLGPVPFVAWVNMNCRIDDVATIADREGRVIARGNTFLSGYDECKQWTDLPKGTMNMLERACELVIANQKYSHTTRNSMLLSGVEESPDWGIPDKEEPAEEGKHGLRAYFKHH